MLCIQHLGRHWQHHGIPLRELTQNNYRWSGKSHLWSPGTKTAIQRSPWLPEIYSLIGTINTCVTNGAVSPVVRVISPCSTVTPAPASTRALLVRSYSSSSPGKPPAPAPAAPASAGGSPCWPGRDSTLLSRVILAQPLPPAVE